MTAVPAHIAELAGVIAAQAQAIADGRVQVPEAAARRLTSNVETLESWIRRDAEGLPASTVAVKR